MAAVTLFTVQVQSVFKGFPSPPPPCLCSFGMVLTRGHGKLMFMGNVSVEEGRRVSHNSLQHSVSESTRSAAVCVDGGWMKHQEQDSTPLQLFIHDLTRQHNSFLNWSEGSSSVCFHWTDLFVPSSAGLHDLTSPDLSIASEWYVWNRKTSLYIKNSRFHQDAAISPLSHSAVSSAHRNLLNK